MSDVKILLVEDDVELRELVTMYLESEQYTVIGVENGEEASAVMETVIPDLAILDMWLPGMNGIAVCEQLRKVSNIPVLFLSGERSSEMVVSGLESGADDYITKPFDPAVLVARVKANLRRFGLLNTVEGGAVKRFGRLEIHPDSMDVTVDGNPVPLFSKELQLLLFFAESPNVVFSARQLHERIWGWDATSDERTVMVHISNLRKKIEQNPAAPKLIQTVRGFGYKFVPGI